MVYNMKHLKAYKVFESTSDIFDDVSDILRDVEDNGFLVRTQPCDSCEMKVYIESVIEKVMGNGQRYEKASSYLVNDTILDAVQHLSSYLSKNGYKLVVEAISGSDVIAHQEYYHRDLGDNISSINDLFEFIGRAPIDYLRLLIYKHK